MDKGQMKKGVLEMCILKTVSENDLYGYEIMKKISAAFPDINESTVYSVLRRLHSDGCTECYFGDISGGPRRKYYRMTTYGAECLEKMTAEWNEILGAINKFGI